MALQGGTRLITTHPFTGRGSAGRQEGRQHCAGGAQRNDAVPARHQGRGPARARSAAGVTGQGIIQVIVRARQT